MDLETARQHSVEQAEQRKALINVMDYILNNRLSTIGENKSGELSKNILKYVFMNLINRDNDEYIIKFLNNNYKILFHWDNLTTDNLIKSINYLYSNKSKNSLSDILKYLHDLTNQTQQNNNILNIISVIIEVSPNSLLFHVKNCKNIYENGTNNIKDILTPDQINQAIRLSKLHNFNIYGDFFKTDLYNFFIKLYKDDLKTKKEFLSNLILHTDFDLDQLYSDRVFSNEVYESYHVIQYLTKNVNKKVQSNFLLKNFINIVNAYSNRDEKAQEEELATKNWESKKNNDQFWKNITLYSEINQLKTNHFWEKFISKDTIDSTETEKETEKETIDSTETEKETEKETIDSTKSIKENSEEWLRRFDAYKSRYREVLYNGLILQQVMKINGMALRYVPIYIKENNYQITLAAVKNNGCAIVHASSEFRQCHDIIQEALKQNGEVYNLLQDNLRNPFNLSGETYAIQAYEKVYGNIHRNNTDNDKLEYEIYDVIYENYLNELHEMNVLSQNTKDNNKDDEFEYKIYISNFSIVLNKLKENIIDKSKSEEGLNEDDIQLVKYLVSYKNQIDLENITSYKELHKSLYKTFKDYFDNSEDLKEKLGIEKLKNESYSENISDIFEMFQESIVTFSEMVKKINNSVVRMEDDLEAGLEEEKL